MKGLALDDLPEILTAQHIADYLGVSRRRVYEHFQLKAEAGGIPNFSFGNSKRVDKADFIRWKESQKGG
ncbi:helix-turn-helix domain-containing protein [Paenibacillus sp. sptzw28]|uniref:helix-turn-helix domain-containing protein n=1 Tax=Paenibacillus sp. sptzw28 TaxID=715179 RepID=UPI001C6E8346|nr:helix-turn-helix domain-containing protein [Paenibacillus sp. sptzw28]QYR20834.1 helix-turn-helix domain-containing protein [Paenibacillus sp. sptzw28]